MMGKITSDELVSGSIILFILFNVYNLINFIFHFSMARMLSITDYGKVAALFSIIYVMGIFSESMQTIMTKYTSSESDLGKLKNLMKRGLKKTFLAALIIFSIYLLLMIPLASIIKIEYLLLAMTGLAIFSSLLAPINRGIMQGRKMFRKLGINLVLESSMKLILAITFVIIGWRVYGVMIAVLIAASITFLFSFSQIKAIVRSNEVYMKTPKIYQQGLFVFLVIIAITVFYSLDVIIARIIFSEEIAGYYAIASTLGKIVFWGTQPISKAMFTIASSKSKDKIEAWKTFKKSLKLLCLLMLIILPIFYFFAPIVVKVFSGRDVVESSKILFYVASAMGILAFSNLVLLYGLSIKKSETEFKKFLRSIILSGMLFLAMIIIEVLILSFCSGSLLQFSMGLIIASVIFLFGALIQLFWKK